MIDPINEEATTTQPIIGLDNLLKVDILAQNKTLVSELESALYFLIHEPKGIGS